MRSPIERDGPLPRPLRAGRGALHAHARGRAIGHGRPPTKPQAKRVRHGRLRQPTSAGTRRPSKRIAAFAAALGRAEPPRRRSRAGRHHRVPGHQTAHGSHTGDAQHCQFQLESWLGEWKMAKGRREGRDWGRAKGGRETYHAEEVSRMTIGMRRSKVPTVVAEHELDLAHPGVALVGRSKACRRRTRYQRACIQSVRRFLHAGRKYTHRGARDARGRCAWLQPAAHVTCLRSKATQCKRAVGVVPGARDGRRRIVRGAPMTRLAARRVCGALVNPASLAARCQRPPSCGQGAPQGAAKEALG